MTTTAEMLFAPPGLSPEGPGGCEEASGQYKVVPSVVCSMCCLFGIIYCFFGKSGKTDFLLLAENSARLLLCFQATAALKR